MARMPWIQYFFNCLTGILSIIFKPVRKSRSGKIKVAIPKPS